MTPEQKITKAVEILTRYGGIDGGHHKQWVIDQVLRILMTPEEYREFVDDPDYSWDEGVAP